MKKILFFLTIAVTLSFITESVNSQELDSLNNLSKKLMAQNNFEEAFLITKKAAFLGHPESQYNFGYFYQIGTLVDQNDSLAHIWYMKSAKQGWADAQYKMAYNYGTGRGVKKNMQESSKWLIECSKKGDEECIFQLAGFYKDGIGLSRSFEKFIYWFKILSKKENPEDLQKSGFITSARLTLARLYRDGEAIEKDLVKSYMWYLIYNEGKVDFSSFQQEEVISEIKELEKELYEDAISLAKVRAEILLQRSLRNVDRLYKIEL